MERIRHSVPLCSYLASTTIGSAYEAPFAHSPRTRLQAGRRPKFGERLLILSFVLHGMWSNCEVVDICKWNLAWWRQVDPDVSSASVSLFRAPPLIFDEICRSIEGQLIGARVTSAFQYEGGELKVASILSIFCSVLLLRDRTKPRTVRGGGCSTFISHIGET